MGTKASYPGYVLRAQSADGDELILSLSGRVALDDADRLLAEMKTLLASGTVGTVKIDLADRTWTAPAP
jgi:hypothetical protein